MNLPVPTRLVSSRAKTAWRLAAYGVIVVTAIVAPLILNLAGAGFLDEGFGKGYAIFALYAVSAAIGVTLISVLEFRRRARLGWAAVLPVALATLIAFHFLIPLSENRGPTSDYRRYQVAAEDVLSGNNPYEIGGARKYLYPPMTAQVLAGAYRSVVTVQRVLGRTVDSDQAWLIVFYLYQGGQLLLILLAYPLCFLLLRDMGVGPVHAHVIGAVLVVFSAPLALTLRHNQVNLLILDLILLGLWAARRWPWVTGVAFALAVHVKVYPVILLLPFAALRHWRVVLWTVVGILAVALVQTGFGRDWTLWQAYGGFMFSEFPSEHSSIRNTSILATSFNLCRVLRDDCARWFPVLQGLARAAALALAVWFVHRGVTRVRLAPEDHDASSDGPSRQSVRLYSSAADALAFALLASPIVWDHHYLLAVPLVLCAVAWRGEEHPWWVGLGAGLVVAVPVFGYHRIAGLVVLLLLTAPRQLRSPGPPKMSRDTE